MGLFDVFKSKYSKLKREEVVSAMLSLQEQEQALEDGLTAKQAEITALMNKGKKETDRTIKLFYAKKINSLKAERENNVQRAMYLMYNLQLLGKLKDAIDDKNFIANVGKVPLNKLLANQKDLAKFLNQALNNKIKSEDIMTSADEVFADVQASYEPNEGIYGVNNKDDELLAMFQTDDALSDETEIAGLDGSAQNKDKEELK